MKASLPVLVTLIVLAFPGAVHAQAGDAARGQSLARQVCSECHSVLAQETRSPNPKAPPFVVMATTPGMTPTALTVALTTPHAGMPMFKLTEDQRADLIAYILGLKGAAKAPGR